MEQDIAPAATAKHIPSPAAHSTEMDNPSAGEGRVRGHATVGRPLTPTLSHRVERDRHMCAGRGSNISVERWKGNVKGISNSGMHSLARRSFDWKGIKRRRERAG